MIPAPAAPVFPQPGEILAGKYRVERVLGAGGMGVVVAARHLVLDQRVAIKLLLPAAASLPGATERFLREARAAVAIRSDHVARVGDVGTLDTGAPYMVMEHLTGEDLGQVLKACGTLPIDMAVEIVLQAGEALAEAHALGIAHRDLKPGNLFLTRRPDGTLLVKVLDFGLSKAANTAAPGPSDASLTATGFVIGSVYYMAPEQFRGLKYADERSDIWALGVILYQLLAARRPFTGDSYGAVCAAVLADDPPPLRSVRPDVPPPLEAAILRCLDKDPARRTQTVGELARALAPFAPEQAATSLRQILRFAPESHTAIGASGAISARTASSQTDHAKPEDTSGSAATRPRARTRPLMIMVATGAVTLLAALGIFALLRARTSPEPIAVEPPPSRLPLPPSAPPIMPDDASPPKPSADMPIGSTVLAPPPVAPASAAHAAVPTAAGTRAVPPVSKPPSPPPPPSQTEAPAAPPPPPPPPKPTFSPPFEVPEN